MKKAVEECSKNVFTGSIIIFGINGAGKSSLMAHIAEIEAFNEERTRLGNIALEKVCKNFDIDPIEKTHFVYSKEKMSFKKEGFYSRKSHDFDPKKMGIQSEAPKGVECCFLPEYSVPCVDEAQTYWPSRDGGENGGKNYQFSFHEKKRHNNLMILMTTPDAMLIDKRIRNSSIGIHIMERKNYEKGTKLTIVWNVRVILAGNLNHYLSCSESEKKNFYTDLTIIRNKTIYDVYDAQSERHLFTDDMTREQILEAIKENA